MTSPTPSPDARGIGWRNFLRDVSRGVDHDAVYGAVRAAGLANRGYAVMSGLSAAIATLGLMLSSPAVVIGAMLISPLMSPIIMLGFAFWMVDLRATRRALESLAVGLGVALAVAFVLTLISPLKEPTSEILSRTHPNLFDLLVAAFSGVAGGYAVVRHRGEAVIGVAIATALMPPIATVGFGLGTANWAILLGALLLFATNLIAIALAAAAMAALYGFRPHFARRRWIGQAAVILIVGGLCVPLTLSLNTIALESRATVLARSEIHKVFGPKARPTSLTVRSEKGGLDVDALVATPSYRANASAEIGHQLSAAIGAPAHVNLDQVVIGDPQRFASEQAATAIASPNPADAVVQSLREAVPFPARSIAYDAEAHRGVVVLAPANSLDLPGMMALEGGLQRHDGLEGTIVIPPIRALLPVALSLSGRNPPVFDSALDTDVWALRRWGAQSASAILCGLAGRRSRREAVEKALAAALAPITLKASMGSWRDCRTAGASGPAVLLAAT